MREVAERKHHHLIREEVHDSERLFRQRSAGDWTSVFSAMERELRQMLGR